jgi:hypothetical protein
LHVGTNSADASCDVDTRDPGFRFGQADAAHETCNVRVAADHVPVVGVHCGGVHLEKDFARTDPGLARLYRSQRFGCPETVLHNRCHQIFATIDLAVA